MHSELRDDGLFLAGDITVKTVNAAAFGQFVRQCGQSGWQALDLGGVNRADSACLSLLLEAKRRRPQGVAIRNAPESVRLLTELYEIESWINP